MVEAVLLDTLDRSVSTVLATGAATLIRVAFLCMLSH